VVKQLPTEPIPVRPEISRDFVLEHRRSRLAAAAAELLHGLGRSELTVGMLVHGAGTARNSFYEVFENLNGCLAFAVNDATDQLLRPVRAAAGTGEWQLGLREGIMGFYDAVVEDPLGAELVLIHSFSIELGPDQAGFEEAVGDLVRLLTAGRISATAPPPLAEEYWARVTMAGAAAALRDGDLARLSGLASQLSDLIDTCFLGHEPAARGQGETLALER
jgi:AcrR family transcriptional regulator